MKPALSLLLASAVFAAAPDRPWQRITAPGYAEAARAFEEPPPEYGMVLWWFWNGPMTEADIRRDIEEIRRAGVRSVLIWPYYGISIEYLSPLWFERVRYAVNEARRLDMRVWLMDEGSYPSGFVGGKVTRDYPELAMRVIAPGAPEPVSSGQRYRRRFDPDVIAVIARNRATPEPILLSAPDVDWIAPDGEWTVTPVRAEFRTSPTRHANRPGFAKDSKYSLFDPLNPAATRRFLLDVHEQYRKYVGAEFGRTIMGFMGDEPSVAGLPYTPTLFDEFRARKGYDARPYLAQLPDRVRADVHDIWTDLYDRHFFRPQTEWCARNGLEYIVHLCGEEDLATFIKLNGDYFKCNRTVQIPGVDAIWRQIWPGVIADYPKLASSAAHLNGRPRAFTESYAVYGMGLSLEMAKWVMDHQFVRGINHFQAMEFLSSPDEYREYFHPPDWRGSPLWSYFPQLAAYANRVSYLLSVGRPTAGIALYYPVTSGWIGDFDADKSALAIARELLESQRDFDFIGEDGIAEAQIRDGALWNRSGQAYRTLIVPRVSAMSRPALSKLEQFARSGGRVQFTGGPPAIAPDRSYRDAAPPGDLSWAIHSGSLAAIPASDVRISPPAPALKYLRRKLGDADVYFFFNESDRRLDLEVNLAAAGPAEIWDPLTGLRRRFSGTRAVFEGYESKIIVASAKASATLPEPPLRLELIEDIGGSWDLALGAKRFRTGLKPWRDLGEVSYWGAGFYRKEIRLSAEQARSGLWLDLGEVRYGARVKLNGRDLGVRAWRPYRWSLAGIARAGSNVLEIEVRNTRANELADPARFAELDAKGYFRNSYIKMYGKFDEEALPSGLIGPVRLYANEK